MVADRPPVGKSVARNSDRCGTRRESVLANHRGLVEREREREADSADNEARESAPAVSRRTESAEYPSCDGSFAL